jgi:hypothetical protein
MGSYIESAKTNIVKIVEGIVASEKCDVQFALVKYRDHPPQDSTFVTDVKPFTPSLSKMREYVNTMAAAGGGDGPEAVADGLYEALHLPYRKGSARIVVIIADAPPHGLEPSGDGFPNGSPNGHDPIKIAKQMAENDILIYSVLCEPGINSYSFARDFFIAISKITGGQYLPLSSAHLLPPVIIGGATETLSFAEIQAQLEQEAEEIRKTGNKTGAELEQEIVARMEQRLKEQKIETNQVQITSLYSAAYDMKNVDLYEHCESLSSAKEKAVRHTEKVYVDDAFSTPQVTSHSKSAVAGEQVQRMTKKTMHKKAWY